MPFCAHCGWGYQGTAHFCGQCGRPLYRSPAAAQLQAVPAGEPAPEPAARSWPSAVTLFGLGLAAGLAAGSLVALDPAFAFASAGGIEATLAASLGLGALVAFLARRPALCGVLLALAILTRLEAAGLAALLGLAAVPPLARALIEGR